MTEVLAALIILNIITMGCWIYREYKWRKTLVNLKIPLNVKNLWVRHGYESGVTDCDGDLFTVDDTMFKSSEEYPSDCPSPKWVLVDTSCSEEDEGKITRLQK